MKVWEKARLTFMGLMLLGFCILLVSAVFGLAFGLIWSINHWRSPIVWSIWAIPLLVLAFYMGRSYDQFEKEGR